MTKDRTQQQKQNDFRLAFNKGTYEFGQESWNVLLHQLDLIKEEALEVEDAIIRANPKSEHILKEVVDLKYVCDDLLNAMGWDGDTAYNRVHDSNMSKLGDTGKPVYRKDGKVLKGPNYKPPYLKDLV